MDSTNITFNNKWIVWYHHTTDDWTISGYKQIFIIANMKDFWNFHNNIDCIGGINNLHYFLMREGVTPTYEDPRNRNGGVWSLLVSMNKAYETWEQLAILMIGENLIPTPSSITGISINVKSDVSVIKIWNNNKINSSVKQLPAIKNIQSEIIYKNHKFNNRNYY